MIDGLILILLVLLVDHDFYLLLYEGLTVSFLTFLHPS